MVPLAQDFFPCGGSRRCSTGRSHSPTHYVQSFADAIAGSVPSSFRECLLVQVMMGSDDSVISIITSSDYSVQMQESQPVQFLFMKQIIFFTFLVPISYLSSPSWETEARSTFITWDSACQAFPQNKISCKKKLPVLSFVLLSFFCDDGQCSVGLGTLANDFRAVLEF